MQNNYAFIDAQNLNSGLHMLGWKIDWKRFREYLRDERGVEVAYVFLGFMLGNQDLYLMLQKSGFVVVFKEILTMESGEVKGNIDAELVLQAMVDYDRYEQALIVSWDGDFTCLLRYLDQNNKFQGVIAPHEKGLSSLIGKVAGDRVVFLRSLKKQIEYRPSRQNSKRMPKPLVHSDIGAVPQDVVKQTAPEKNIPTKDVKIKKPHIYSRNKKNPKPPKNPQDTVAQTQKSPRDNRNNEVIYGGFGE